MKPQKNLFLYREFKEEPFQLEVSIPLCLGVAGGGHTDIHMTQSRIWPRDRSSENGGFKIGLEIALRPPISIYTTWLV